MIVPARNDPGNDPPCTDRAPFAPLLTLERVCLLCLPKVNRNDAVDIKRDDGRDEGGRPPHGEAASRAP